MTMTASPGTDNPQVAHILNELRNISNEVKQIDVELGTDDKGPVAQRNKFTNQYVSQFGTSNIVDGNEQNELHRFATKIVDMMKTDERLSSSTEQQIATVKILTDAIDKEFGTNHKEFLQKLVDAQPKSDTPEVSDDRKQELAIRRSNITQMFKLQTEMLRLMGFTSDLPSDIEVPTVRRGAVGKRVKLTKEYQFFVDGNLKQLTDADTGEKTNPNLSYIATTVCKDLGWKTKQLRDFIAEAVGVNESDGSLDLPSEWEVTLPAPVSKTLRGVAVTVTDSAVGVDDSEDDDDNDDDENGDSSDFANI